MKKELKLVKNEGIKESSNGLRGTIHEELMDSESIKFTGDNQQIDLKDKHYSAIHDVSKIMVSNYVYKRILEDNHRHEAIDEVFNLLNGV